MITVIKTREIIPCIVEVIQWPFALSWNPRLRFFSTFSSSFFFFFFQPAIVDFVNCEQCICVLFTVPQITLFSNFFIKNGSHNTIYTFKNYFATVFLVSVFSFSKNKLNPNTPLVSYLFNPFIPFPGLSVFCFFIYFLYSQKSA